jgi:hypothetical protein
MENNQYQELLKYYSYNVYEAITNYQSKTKHLTKSIIVYTKSKRYVR